MGISENEQGNATNTEGDSKGHALFAFHTKHADYMTGN